MADGGGGRGGHRRSFVHLASSLYIIQCTVESLSKIDFEPGCTGNHPGSTSNPGIRVCVCVNAPHMLSIAKVENHCNYGFKEGGNMTLGTV